MEKNQDKQQINVTHITDISNIEMNYINDDEMDSTNTLNKLFDDEDEVYIV